MRSLTSKCKRILTLVHDTQDIQRISHLGKIRILIRVFIKLNSHIDHQGTLGSDLDVPQDVRKRRNGTVEYVEALSLKLDMAKWERLSILQAF